MIFSRKARANLPDVISLSQNYSKNLVQFYPLALLDFLGQIPIATDYWQCIPGFGSLISRPEQCVRNNCAATPANTAIPSFRLSFLWWPI